MALRGRNEAVWLILLATEQQSLELRPGADLPTAPAAWSALAPAGTQARPGEPAAELGVRQAAASLRPLPLLSVSPLLKSHGRRPAARPQRH